MITSEEIKVLVENEFNVEDIARRTRQQPYPQIRHVYCALCRIFTDESLAKIGRTIERDHATILYNISQFDQYKTQPFFRKFVLHYENIYITITELRKEKKGQLVAFRSIRECEAHYKERMVQMAEKQSKVRRNILLLNRIEPLQKISELPEDFILDFERLANAFYNSKKAQIERIKRSA